MPSLAFIKSPIFPLFYLQSSTTNNHTYSTNNCTHQKNNEMRFSILLTLLPVAMASPIAAASPEAPASDLAARLDFPKPCPAYVS